MYCKGSHVYNCNWFVTNNACLYQICISVVRIFFLIYIFYFSFWIADLCMVESCETQRCHWMFVFFLKSCKNSVIIITTIMTMIIKNRTYLFHPCSLCFKWEASILKRASSNGNCKKRGQFLETVFIWNISGGRWCVKRSSSSGIMTFLPHWGTIINLLFFCIHLK